MDVVVLADDITGANITAALLASRGFRAASSISSRSRLETFLDFDAVVWNAGTRLAPRNMARVRIKEMTKQAQELRIPKICKRIDSTLRGHVSAETEEILNALGDQWAAVVVPAFPATGRTTREGIHYVDHIPVHDTEAGKDPYSPLTHSRLPDLLREYSGRQVYHVGMDVVRGPLSAVIDLLHEQYYCHGCRIFSFDACSLEDIERIAAAVAALTFPVVPVDPGPFTASFITRTVGKGRYSERENTVSVLPTVIPTALEKTSDVCLSADGFGESRLFVVSGSVMEAAKVQLYRLKEKMGAHMTPLDVNVLTDEERRRETLDQIVIELRDAAVDSKIIGIRTDSIPYTGSEANLARLIGRFAKDVLERISIPVGGLYLSGGEVAQETLLALEALGIDIIDEVLPHAVRGQIIGGARNGLPVVTKGGVAGDANAVVRCISVLENNHHRR